MEQPIAYKFIGTYYTWLVDEADEEFPQIVQPIYAPIEDEE